MVGQKGVKNVKYLNSRKKSTKARKCKFKGCKNTIREENKSGYCSLHYKESPKGKMARIRLIRDQKNRFTTIHLDKELNNKFAEFCDIYGFAKKRKLELIVKDFLDKHDANCENHVGDKNGK